MTFALNPNSRTAPYSPVLLAVGVGTFLVVYKLILRSMPPLVVLSVVMGGTALLFAAYLYLSGTAGRLKVKKKELGLLLLLGLCGAILNGAMIWSVELSQASQVSLLIRCDIIFSAMIGLLFFGERITRPGSLGLLMMGTGSFLVLRIFPWQLQVASSGDLLAILAGLLFSTNAIIIKYGLAKVPNEVIVFYNSGLVTILAFSLVLAGGSVDSYSALRSPLTAGLAGLAILFSASTFSLYYLSLALHQVWVVRAFLLMSPFVTMVLGGWILDETIVWSQWVGGALLAGGGTVLVKDMGRASWG